MSILYVPTIPCDKCGVNNAELFGQLHGCREVFWCEFCYTEWFDVNTELLSLRPAVCSVCLVRVVSSPADWGCWSRL